MRHSVLRAGAGVRGAKGCRWKNPEGRPARRASGPLQPPAPAGGRPREARARAALTLHVPRPPDGVVEPDLVPPLELQALELLPLRRHQLPTERREQEGELSGASANAVKPKRATRSFRVPKFRMNPLQATGFFKATWSRRGWRGRGGGGGGGVRARRERVWPRVNCQSGSGGHGVHRPTPSTSACLNSSVITSFLKKSVDLAIYVSMKSHCTLLTYIMSCAIYTSMKLEKKGRNLSTTE